MAGQQGNKVSIRRIIGNVVNKLELDGVSGKISAMADWAVEAELKIGSKNSYVAVECEIDVNNYRACLPSNFVWLIALKHKQDYLEKTMKDFVQFHKGSRAVRLEDETDFIAGNKVLPGTPGVPNVHQVDFLGLFQPGDVITVSVTHDDCGDLTINTYQYTVQPADTIPDIVNQSNVIIL